MSPHTSAARVQAGPVQLATVPRDTLPDLPPEALPAPRAADRPRLMNMRRFLLHLVVLGLVWAMLTDWRLDAWVFGGPAVLLAAAFALLLPRPTRWRLSPMGALVFAVWFAVQSLRGAVDVSLRAFSPRLPLTPGFQRYPLRFAPGAPRVMFVNTISLLPGTLSAEIVDGEVVVHMLDTNADLTAELGALERRIAALFALRAKDGGYS